MWQKSKPHFTGIVVNTSVPIALSHVFGRNIDLNNF